jgi:phenylacetate-CoA ligase
VGEIKPAPEGRSACSSPLTQGRKVSMSWIHNNFILPILEPERHRGLGRRLRALEQFETLSAEHQKAIQAQSVARLLSHAYSSVPYYRRISDEAGFYPSSWKPGEPIPLPLLDKEIIRVQEDQLISRRYSANDLRSARTGGTTSTPVQFWRDVNALREKTALQFHLNRWSGFDQGDSILMVWGAERDLELNPGWRWKFYEQVLMRRIPAAAGQISASIFQGFLDRLNHHRPKVLYGYGVTLARFAEFVRDSNVQHHKPRVIITTAEAITPLERECIELTFGCKATDQYGSRDVGMIGSECEHHSGLHFHPAGCLTEFEYAGMTSDGPMHRLIVTDLLNYGMPLIRYDTGDCVIVDPAPCPCGRFFPRVKAILGRASDNFVLADGTEVPGNTFATKLALLANGFRHITQLQVIQKEMDRVVLLYAANGNPSAIGQELSRVREALQDMVKVTMHCTMTQVPEIRREASGKLRFCISEVNHHSIRPRPRVD